MKTRSEEERPCMHVKHFGIWTCMTGMVNPLILPMIYGICIIYASLLIKKITYASLPKNNI